uniref:Uncharacterized protein n=1 Tax=Oryza meridionalis TaxID=40149 RepID=A0A0E0CGY7_9ORYZ
MAKLMRNPRVRHKLQEKLRREFANDSEVVEERLRSVSYLHMVIKEMLRLHPPMPLLIPHQCASQRQQVLGHDVPEGAMVMVNAWAIGRDTTAWRGAAEEFWPERFELEQWSGRDLRGADMELIPFGAGRRICPGMAMGLANVELLLVALLFHFDLELPAGMAAEEVDMTEAAGVTTWRKAVLLVVVVPRVPVLEAADNKIASLLVCFQFM